MTGSITLHVHSCLSGCVPDRVRVHAVMTYDEAGGRRIRNQTLSASERSRCLARHPSSHSSHFTHNEQHEPFCWVLLISRVLYILPDLLPKL
jgi:hypothetical protein